MLLEVGLSMHRVELKLSTLMMPLYKGVVGEIMNHKATSPFNNDELEKVFLLSVSQGNSQQIRGYLTQSHHLYHDKKHSLP